MTIQTNQIYLQRSSDLSNWTTLETINTTTGGVTADHYFDQPGPGFWYYRLSVFDQNGNAVGRTTIVASVLSR